jgi:hypothetical protein
MSFLEENGREKAEGRSAINENGRWGVDGFERLGAPSCPGSEGLRSLSEPRMRQVGIEYGACLDRVTPMCTGKRAGMGAVGPAFGWRGDGRCRAKGTKGAKRVLPPGSGAWGEGLGAERCRAFLGRKGRRREWRGRWRGS